MKYSFFVFIFLFVFPASAFAQRSAPVVNIPIEVGDAVFGPDDAAVTIVEYADFQCFVSKRAENTLKKIRSVYGDKVRFVFRHFPLDFHEQAAVQASRAAIAAGKQGKFWEMHDLLFKHQKEFKNADMDWFMLFLAKQVGLKEKAFKAAYRDLRTQAKIDRDKKTASSYRVLGTPSFFINGVRFGGAEPFEKFKTIIDDQLKVARKAAKTRRKNEELYTAILRFNLKNIPSYAKPLPPIKMRVLVEWISVDSNAPILGSSKNAMVTIVIFSDFESPYGTKASSTLKKLKKKYGDALRIVFHHRPLPLHKHAEQAARAAVAAHRQGKFWRMHDLLFEKQQKMKKEKDTDAFLMRLAKKAGLNLEQFETDYYSKALENTVRHDIALAKKAHVFGAPSIFINGVNVGGAKSLKFFVTKIDEQIKIAKRIKHKKRLRGEKLYKAVVDHNKKKHAM